jgi:c-di-AMP phosphodiesterase-like protein
MKKHEKQVIRSFACIVILCIVTTLCLGLVAFIRRDFFTGVLGVLFAVLFFALATWLGRKRMQEMYSYVAMISEKGTSTTKDAILSFPMPMAVLQIDGAVMWYNDKFAAIFDDKNLYGIALNTVVPDLRWSDVLKSTNGIHVDAHYKGHHYEIFGDIVKNVQEEEEVYSVLLYFIDRTEEEQLQARYDAEKTDIAIITIDNYDEILQKMDDSNRQQVLAEIDKSIRDWVEKSNGVLKKTERDRYIVLFEHQYLQRYIDEKFDILDQVRSLGEGVKQPISISIGIGVGDDLQKNEAYSRAAIDMALGRGGDQVSVKDESQYKFYGGKSKEYEKSTRVKTRAFALALREFIQQADKVILMGHNSPDFDSFGAAIGLQRAVRTLGKKPYIVIDNTNAVQKIYKAAKEKEEYEGMFVDGERAIDLVTNDTLLIILDTHKPSLLPCASLLEMAQKIVLVDHHRRSTEFIQNTSLVYHEPYASSTCEMVTEILQYIDDNKKMTTFEAEALYVGILMDTKNFVMKTGVRTFEAASYLKRYGINTVAVKSLFDIDKTDYVHKVDIVKTAEFVSDHIVAAVCAERYPNIKVISAQAADELLEISGVHASFVIFEADSQICISGRSLGDVNVQVILEKMGGGGHMTVAGVQIKDSTIEKVKVQLAEAIREYLQESSK